MQLRLPEILCGWILFSTAHASGLEEQTEGCSSACSKLADLFPRQVLHRDSSAFDNFTLAYWAGQQQDDSPRCVFTPAVASEIATFLGLVQDEQCHFAVKAGGHGAFAGVSSITDGIVLSLQLFNEITVLDESESPLVAVGTGNTWLDVYQALEQRGLAVPGGRYPSVGVGGLSLGGGESFFASERGWTCDNIQEYEIVTAGGEVIHADNTSSSDLHWALRGGGNNFGVVTKIHIEAFALSGGNMWGGVRISNVSDAPALLTASYNLGNDGPESDPGAGLIVSIVRSQETSIAMSLLSNTEPVDPPAVMAEFLAVPALQDTTGVKTLAMLSAEFGGGEGFGQKRRARATATFRLRAEMLAYADEVCAGEYEAVTDEVDELEATCVFQVITSSQLAASDRKGGNALGLDPEDAPLFLFNIVYSWREAADDAVVSQTVKRITARTTEYGAAQGWDINFRYMNYAGEFQDVFSGYGTVNTDRLRATAQKYNPTGVFQKLQPGYFKLLA